MITHQQIQQARRHLSRFDDLTTSVPIFPPAAVTAVVRGMDTRYTTVPVATDEDIAAAALLLDEARRAELRRLDDDELTILDGLLTLGWTFKKLGEHLGYEGPTAAAQASSRVKRLRRAMPSWAPPVRPTPATPAGTSPEDL